MVEVVQVMLIAIIYSHSHMYVCIDHSECDNGTDSCDQHCHNTNGSYYCTCDDGYKLQPDGNTCQGIIQVIWYMNTIYLWYSIDIDECKYHLAGCNQICINTIGNYTCDCFKGFQLKANNRTCIGEWMWFIMSQYESLHYTHTDINECLFDNGGCNQTCTNTTGSYKCSCDEGFNLNTDHHGCDG